MHELFLTTHIANDDLQRALKIMQGYTGMSPVHLTRRKLTWDGPRTRTPRGIDPNFINGQHPAKQQIWKMLSEQLSRQSYTLTLLYDIGPQEFGKPQEETNGNEASPREGLALDQTPGTIRWTDIPDPASSRMVNGRPIISIENEKNLCLLMRSLNHRFTKEVIQESNRFVHGNVVIEFSRFLTLPPNPNETLPTIRNPLPPFEDLLPFDAEDKWILTASAITSNGNDPEQMSKAIEELMRVKTDFEGCFEFQMMDRHIFDTRVKM